MGKPPNSLNGNRRGRGGSTKSSSGDVTEHPHEWYCDVDGKVYDADKKLKSPAVKIVTIERLSTTTRSKMSWTSEVHELQPNGRWDCIHPKHGTGRSYYKKQKGAFAAAFLVAKAHFHHKYLTALRTESKDYGDLKRLLGRLKDEARMEEKVIADRTIPRHRLMEGDDLLLAEQILTKEFPLIAENLNVLFLFRQQCKGRTTTEWQAGKDSRGKKLNRFGICKKLSNAEADTYRTAFGYAPDFVIIFCEVTWAKAKTKDPERCKYMVRHELCHIGYDAEKGSTWTVAHDLEEFQKAVVTSAPRALPSSRLSFLRNAVHHFEQAHQMNLLEMLGEPDDTPDVSVVPVGPASRPILDEMDLDSDPNSNTGEAEVEAQEEAGEGREQDSPDGDPDPGADGQDEGQDVDHEPAEVPAEKLRGIARIRQLGRDAAREEVESNGEVTHDNPCVRKDYRKAWDDAYHEEYSKLTAQQPQEVSA